LGADQPDDPLLSLTYFDIDYEDRIALGGPPGSPTSVLLQEDQWAELIHRNPSAAEVAELCSSPQFFGDPNDCTVTPPVAIVDLRLRNLGVVHVRGVDVEVRRSFITDVGTFGLGIVGTHMFDYERAASDTSPTFELIDTVNNPLATRLRGSVSWQRGGWSANTSVNYANSYEDDVSSPARGIDSWTTVDLQFGYRTQPRTGWSSGLSFLLSAINLFDEEPPFYNSREGYDNVNASLRGRVISAQVTKSWR